MYKKVLRAIKKNKMIPDGQKVAVAVSGGPDSLSLLHVLHTLSAQLRILLHVIHVNHRLRPESDKEEIFVKKLCISMGVPVTVCRINVKGLQRKNHMSLQAAARLMRYQALKLVASRIGAAYVATAHHRDDQIETLLLRLLTGSGLDGLKGIPIRRKLSADIEIIRPLYDITRREIEQYCRQHSLAALQDPTNQKPVYLRNRIRLKLLPFMEKEFGAHIRNTLAHTAQLLAADSELLTRITNKVYDTIKTEQKEGGVSLKLTALKREPRVLQARIVRKALWEAGAGRVESSHIHHVLAVAFSSSPSAWCRIPKDIIVQREYDRLRISHTVSTHSAQTCVPLQVPGMTFLPWSKQYIKARVLMPNELHLPPANKMEAYLSLDHLKQPFFVRTRKAGDRIHLFGRPGSRKLKDIFIDEKIPQKDRDLIPLVISDEKIIWVAGLDIADSCRIIAATKKVLHLSIKKFEH